MCTRHVVASLLRAAPARARHHRSSPPRRLRQVMHQGTHAPPPGRYLHAPTEQQQRARTRNTHTGTRAKQRCVSESIAT